MTRTKVRVIIGKCRIFPRWPPFTNHIAIFPNMLELLVRQIIGCKLLNLMKHVTDISEKYREVIPDDFIILARYLSQVEKQLLGAFLFGDVGQSFYSQAKNSYMAGSRLQWLKLPAWGVGDRGFEPHPGLHVLKKQNVPSPLTRQDSILWGASVGA